MLFFFSMFCRLTLQRNTENHEPADNSSKFALRCCDNYGFTATRWGRGAEFCRKKGLKHHKNARTTDFLTTKGHGPRNFFTNHEMHERARKIFQPRIPRMSMNHGYFKPRISRISTKGTDSDGTTKDTKGHEPRIFSTTNLTNLHERLAIVYTPTLLDS